MPKVNNESIILTRLSGPIGNIPRDPEKDHSNCMILDRWVFEKIIRKSFTKPQNLGIS